MCRKLALAATILMTPLLLAAPQAYAFGFGKPAAQPTVASGASASAPSAVPPMARPNADERAAADRMEPLGRAAYWASQVSADPKDVEAGLKLAGALRALGRYQEAFEAAGQFHKRAEGRELDDLAFDQIAHPEMLVDVAPRVFGELFESE